MNTDALFQLGIVSVALNTSQTEELSSRLPRRHLRSHARAASAARACLCPVTCLHRKHSALRRAARVRRHPMQDQFCHSRTPR